MRILLFLAVFSVTTTSAFVGWPSRSSQTTFFPTRTPAVAADGDRHTSIDAHHDFVICGAGPAGLLTAIMLAQQERLDDKKKKMIHVYDRLAPPFSPDDEQIWGQTEKFYLIGLGGRGQMALRRFGVWDSVERRCVGVLGRKDWTPQSREGVERIFQADEKLVVTQVLPRDKLVGVLYEHILDHYNDRIVFHFGAELSPLDFAHGAEGNQVLLRIAQCSADVANLTFSQVKQASYEAPEVLCDVDDEEAITTTVSTDMLIAADGTVRTIANAMERLDQETGHQPPFRVVRYPDDNQRIYKTIPFRIPDSWRRDLNYSVRSVGSRVIFEALPANTRGDYAGVMLLKVDDPMAISQDPVEFRQFLDEYLPQFSPLIDDNTVATVAAKPVSYLPGFRYVGPRLHQGNRCVMLGDCAHTVKPYFGLGANSALQDVSILADMFQATDYDLTKAVHSYSQQQAYEAADLVRISRELDRPGTLGLLTFVAPLILDAIFHKAAPAVFSPNTITMLQREAYTFEQVGRIKRRDRVGQLMILGTGAYGSFWGLQQVVGALQQALGG
mmetsp:Transcript_18784/g.37707  ORF Transcript_18784/g.37707 Transcript_18784/m.37707 type:complete len:556 (+) Transcript_18784:86-1753(+)